MNISLKGLLQKALDKIRGALAPAPVLAPILILIPIRVRPERRR